MYISKMLYVYKKIQNKQTKSTYLGPLIFHYIIKFISNIFHEYKKIENKRTKYTNYDIWHFLNVSSLLGASSDMSFI